MGNDIEMSELRMAATGLHELYCTFKDAGFTAEEAPHLTAAAMTNAHRD